MSSEIVEECVGCGSSELSEISYHFQHKVSKDTSDDERHLLCIKCLIELTTICCCDKEFTKHPNTLMVYCPCTLELEPTKLYFDINTPYLLKLLEPYNENYYIINGCQGCHYTFKEIETEAPKALKSAIVSCVYKKMLLDDKTNSGISHKGLEVMTYQSDVLDDNFIRYAEKKGLDLGPCTDI